MYHSVCIIGACDVNIPAVPAKRYQAFMSQWISQSAAAAACQDAGGQLADLGTNCKLDAIRYRLQQVFTPEI